MRSLRGIVVLVCGLSLVSHQLVLGADAPPVQYLTDLSRAQPTSALSQGPREGCWQLIPYETVDDAHVKAGTMVGAASFIQVPDITIPLGVSGWHAVYLGYWNPYHAYDGGATIKAKLSDDASFVRMKQPEPSLEYKMEGSRYVSQTALKEVFCRNADLTGRDLVLGKVCGPFGEKVYLAYIKLVPLSEEEVAAITSRRASPDARTLQGSIDGISYNTSDPPIHAAAQAKGCRIVSAVWDIDSSADTAEGRSRDSQEVRDRVQDVSIRLKTVGGIDVGQGYWDTAFSGG